MRIIAACSSIILKSVATINPFIWTHHISDYHEKMCDTRPQYNHTHFLNNPNSSNRCTLAKRPQSSKQAANGAIQDKLQPLGKFAWLCVSLVTTILISNVPDASVTFARRRRSSTDNGKYSVHSYQCGSNWGGKTRMVTATVAGRILCTPDSDKKGLCDCKPTGWVHFSLS